MSPKDTLSLADLKTWVKNTLIFSSPALIAFLVSLQNHQSMTIAWGMFTQALIASIIDLLRKYSAGN